MDIDADIDANMGIDMMVVLSSVCPVPLDTWPTQPTFKRAQQHKHLQHNAEICRQG